jgi:cytochrome c biogenesis protein CcmG/thiol:disulfide interchange protein DsbE
MRHISICLFLGLLTACATARAPQPQVKAGVDRLQLVLNTFPGPGDANLGALTGKVVLVDFWATWCGPCHEAATGYQGLYQRFHARGLEVYGVSLDEDTRGIPEFLREQGVTYPTRLDPGAAVSGQKFGLQSIPAAILADRKGVVRFAHAGFGDEELAQLSIEIEQLLGEPSPASP